MYELASLTSLGSTKKTEDEGENHASNYTAVFQAVIPRIHKDFFEKKWLIDTYNISSAFKGYRHRTVHLLSHQGDYLEYAMCLNFDNIDNLNRWLVSPERANTIGTLEKMGARTYRINHYGGVAEPGSMEESLRDRAGSSTSVGDDARDVETGDSSNAKPAKRNRADSIKASRIELQDTSALLPRPRPPAKWKLWMLVFFCVMMSMLSITVSGSITSMAALGLPTGCIVMLTVLQFVPVMVYALMPIVISIPVVNNWLRAPRCAPEQMSPLYSLLDQGLQIFAERKRDIPPEVQSRLDMVEGKLDRLRRAIHRLTTRLDENEAPPHSQGGSQYGTTLMSANARNADTSAATRYSSSMDCQGTEGDSKAPASGSTMFIPSSASSTASFPTHASGLNTPSSTTAQTGSVSVESASSKSERLPSKVVSIPDIEDTDALLDKEGILSGPTAPVPATIGPPISTGAGAGIDRGGTSDPTSLARKYLIGSSANAQQEAIQRAETLAASISTQGGEVNLPQYPQQGQNSDNICKHRVGFERPSHDGVANKHCKRSLKLAGDGLSEPSSKPANILRSTSSIINTDKAADTSEPLTMVVRHYVKWERALDFERWTDEMNAEMSKFEGYQGILRIAPKKDGDPHINSFTFDSLAHMLAFANTSQRRLVLLNQLEDMLEATSVAELNQERVIQDAFTELFVATGESAASRPPPLWKTCILTAIPLVIFIWQVSTSLGGILLNVGVHRLLVVPITVLVNSLTNVYVGVPLMNYHFGDWLHLRRETSNSNNSGNSAQALSPGRDTTEGRGTTAISTLLDIYSAIQGVGVTLKKCWNEGMVLVMISDWRIWRFFEDGFPRWAQYCAVAIFFGLNLGIGFAEGV